MRIFIGSKVINAEPMNHLEYNALRGWELPENENGADEGYLVEYLDGGQANHPNYNGYISWSPKDVFERAYHESGELSFGDAVELMKQFDGLKLAREGWNGKGMYIYYVPANEYPVQTEAARSEFGEMVPYEAYIAFRHAGGKVVPWLASQTDILAEDWSVVG